MSDRIFIRGLCFETIIGVRPHERTNPQPVIIDIDIETSFGAVLESARLEDTVSYSDICRDVEAFITQQQFELLETLAARTTERLLEDLRIRSVRFKITKPEAVPAAEGVGVEIQRSR